MFLPNFIPTVAVQSLESLSLRASLQAASQSLPLGLSHPGSHFTLCPLHCHLSSLCSPSALQQPRVLGGVLYIESITTYCPHVGSEQAGQDWVRILAIGTFTFFTDTFMRDRNHLKIFYSKLNYLSMCPVFP